MPAKFAIQSKKKKGSKKKKNISKSEVTKLTFIEKKLNYKEALKNSLIKDNQLENQGKIHNSIKLPDNESDLAISEHFSEEGKS